MRVPVSSQKERKEGNTDPRLTGHGAERGEVGACRSLFTGICIRGLSTSIQ